MGLLDRLRTMIKTDRTQRQSDTADPEDLLTMSSAALTMAELGYDPVNEAALCFQAADGFNTTLADLQSVVDATSQDNSTVREDDHGYRWLIIHDAEIESLASALQFAAMTFQDKGTEEELLAAVFGFQNDKHAYWIYRFDRGTFYPFVPDGTDEQDMGEAFKLQSVLAEELPIEEDKSEWYPLWPDRPGAHPWE